MLFEDRIGDPVVCMFRYIDGSRADVYTGSRTICSDADAQDQSHSRVFLSLHGRHSLLYSRRYARQLRSTGTPFL